MAYTARIEVQDSFCDVCSISIKKELQEIDDVKNIRLYPKESLVTFNFLRVNNLSTVLNILTEIGFPEKGERRQKRVYHKIDCDC